MEIVSTWTVKRIDGNGTRSRCIARCSCGDISEYDKNNIDRGNSIRCRKCANKSRSEKRSTHGCSISMKESNPEGYLHYAVWQGMKRRCYLKTTRSYKNYGARGIVVCERWLESFDNFIEDMGFRPSKLYEIDRIDTNGNYELGNCRWATKKQNSRNKRNTVMLTINGDTRPMAEWAEISGESYDNIKNRISNLGWSHGDAVFGKKKKKVYNTPMGKFETLEDISKLVDVGISSISRRFKSDNFKDWFID
jgi:hypothetical protein